MVSGLSAANNQFLASIDILQNNLSQADEQLSSGYKVNQASDAPQSVQDIFVTRAELGQDNQDIQNLSAIQGQVQSADSAVQSAIQLLNQAVSLGTQGASNTSSSSSQQVLASQVQGIESQLVAIANTEVSGVYVSAATPAHRHPIKWTLPALPASIA